MRKLLIAVLLIGVLAVPASAGPWHWIKTHKRFLAMEGAATGSAILGAKALEHCRSTGVEKCTGHYGAAWGIFGTGVGINFAMTAAAEGCWKGDGGHFCDVFGFGGSAAQTVWGLHEWILKSKAEEKPKR